MAVTLGVRLKKQTSNFWVYFWVKKIVSLYQTAVWTVRSLHFVNPRLKRENIAMCDQGNKYYIVGSFSQSASSPTHQSHTTKCQLSHFNYAIHCSWSVFHAKQNFVKTKIVEINECDCKFRNVITPKPLDNAWWRVYKCLCVYMYNMCVRIYK